jgi:2,4-dienoyl-CoA reductase (NADPH2)
LKFKKLFSPLDIGVTTLQNRFVMGSMHTNLEEIEGGFERAAVYYSERAKTGVGLIITGGISPNVEGCVGPHSAKLSNKEEVEKHKLITSAVKAVGGKICMQILHSGRYGYHKDVVAPSPIQSPVSFFKPHELTDEEVWKTIRDFGHCAKLAKEAGYDGVEIMGSEGYLINQFLVKRTNQRVDDWGGSYINRMKFPLEIIKEIKSQTGKNFIIIYRISMLDLVEGGSSWKQIVALAKEIEKIGVHIINTGIGWHEARIPTIATTVPRMAYSWVTGQMKKEISMPLIAVNRINMPEVAEKILEEGHADLVSMARPFLADPELVSKSREGKDSLINTCIACNQACLDHTFQLKVSSCLVNPRACFETLRPVTGAGKIKKIAVVGAGPAGLAFSVTAAQRGHKVELFESSEMLGGQFNLAKMIPGKEEYTETIRYFTNMLKELNVKVHLSVRVDKNVFIENQFDSIVLATGVYPRIPEIKGIENNIVIKYDDLLSGKRKAGKKVVILGGGGIGFDVAEYLLSVTSNDVALQVQDFLSEWGIDRTFEVKGGLITPENTPPYREVYMLKRSAGKFGNTLGKTTGWIKKIALANKKVKMISGVDYKEINDRGILFTQNNEDVFLQVDSVILCTGQIPNQDLFAEVQNLSNEVFMIGGAFEANELDAKIAIDQAFSLADKI